MKNLSLGFVLFALCTLVGGTGEGADEKPAGPKDATEATRKANGLAQDVAKSEQRTKYQALTAPIDRLSNARSVWQQ